MLYDSLLDLLNFLISAQTGSRYAGVKIVDIRKKLSCQGRQKSSAPLLLVQRVLGRVPI